jgi:hypothetical protein
VRGKRWRAVKHKPQYQPKFMSMYLPKHHRINPVRGLVARKIHPIVCRQTQLI